MDCKHARLLLAFVRPHHPEVDASDANELNQHLESCPVCAAPAHDDGRADEQIGLRHARRAVAGQLALAF